MLGSLPDLLRLVAVPVLGWAAVSDIRTRRVPNRVWLPLALLGGVLLAWEAAAHLPPVGVADRLFLVRVAVSLGFVVTFAYGFWWVGGFGGADAKALMTLAVLFPTYPTYYLSTMALPRVEAVIGVFSLTILTNTVIAGIAYPLVLGARNAVAGSVSRLMFLGRRVDVEDLPTTHGRLFESTDGVTRNGLDLDALRMYLRWRDTSFAALRADPAGHRDPASITATAAPTDGAVTARADGGTGVDTDDRAEEAGAATTADTDVAEDTVAADEPADAGGTVAAADDPWGAAAFFDAIEGTAYGSDPESLRDGLELVTSRERVWVSPGIPFIVPMFVGLVVALTYGDVLVAAMSALGSL